MHQVESERKKLMIQLVESLTQQFNMLIHQLAKNESVKVNLSRDEAWQVIAGATGSLIHMVGQEIAAGCKNGNKEYGVGFIRDLQMSYAGILQEALVSHGLVDLPKQQSPIVTPPPKKIVVPANVKTEVPAEKKGEKIKLKEGKKDEQPSTDESQPA